MGLRPEQQLLVEQLQRLGSSLRESFGSSPDGGRKMWGGAATWEREGGSFHILHRGYTSEGATSHVEVLFALLSALATLHKCEYDIGRHMADQCRCNV